MRLGIGWLFLLFLGLGQIEAALPPTCAYTLGSFFMPLTNINGLSITSLCQQYTNSISQTASPAIVSVGEDNIATPLPQAATDLWQNCLKLYPATLTNTANAWAWPGPLIISGLCYVISATSTSIDGVTGTLRVDRCSSLYPVICQFPIESTVFNSTTTLYVSTTFTTTTSVQTFTNTTITGASTTTTLTTTSTISTTTLTAAVVTTQVSVQTFSETDTTTTTTTEMDNTDQIVTVSLTATTSVATTTTQTLSSLTLTTVTLTSLSVISVPVCPE
jgi:hypothetical protein